MRNDEHLIQPRVFLSSIVDGFEAYRAAARMGIESAGCTAILAEDFPSLRESPRNACLDCVASCDCLAVVIACRGGWSAPSGLLVIHEEFEEARRRGIPVLAFLQEGRPDEKASAFASHVSDYVQGLFRTTFRSPSDLKLAIRAALAKQVPLMMRPTVDTSILDTRLSSPPQFENQATLRSVLLPARKDEFLDPLTLESLDFWDHVMALGHKPTVRLLSYERSKRRSLSTESLVAEQVGRSPSDDGIKAVRFEVCCNGLMVFDINVTGRDPKDRIDSLMDYATILEVEITNALHSAFAFSAELLEWRDPHQRFDLFLFNCALGGIGSRRIVKEAKKQESYSLRMRPDNPLPAYDQPRSLTRANLRDSEDEIRRVVTVLRRKTDD